MERPTVHSSDPTSRLKFVIPKVATALPETATVTSQPITAETVVTPCTDQYLGCCVAVRFVGRANNLGTAGARDFASGTSAIQK